MFDQGRFNNDTIYHDLFLKQFEKEDYESYGIFDQDFFKYAKFLAIEEGLSGFRIEKKVKDYIEGYNDPIIMDVSQTPIEAGGDPTADPWMSINGPKGEHVEGPHAFFSGDDDPTLCRSYASYLGSNTLAIKEYEIDGI